MNQAIEGKGASLLLLHRGVVVFGVKRIVESNGLIIAETTGVGGKVESGETFLEAALRECEEEMGIPAEIVPSSAAWNISEAEAERISSLPDKTLFVVNKIVPALSLRLAIRVYAAATIGTPEPGEELPHLVFCPIQAVVTVAEGSTTMRGLHQLGGWTKSRRGSDLPGRALISFIDSPQVYAPYLQEEILRHIGGLLRLA